ncbi:MAG: tripartite tricarboxylate transporter TctB family protein [Alphaproteobacteria bacterium]
MKISDALTGSALAALGVAAWYGGSLLPPVPGQQVGPSVFPMVIGAGLAACGAAIALGIGSSFEEEETLVTAADVPEAASVPEEPIRYSALKTLVPPVLLFFYAMAVDGLGFWITAAIMVSCVALALGATWRWALILALGAPPFVHIVFAKLLRVPLPEGLLAFPW